MDRNGNPEMQDRPKKKPLYQKWWFWLILVLILGWMGSRSTGSRSAAGEGGATGTPPATIQPAPTTAATTQPTTQAPAVKRLGDGTYLVGKDIESGLYRAVVGGIMGMGYIERASDVSMDFDDIIANIILTGDGYVTIKDTDVAVKLQMVELEPVSLDELAKNIQSEVADGVYLIGYDIAPGTYRVEITDTLMNMGYVERLKDCSMDLGDIIANELFQGNGYVKILESDFAVKVQGAKLIFQE